MSPKTPASQRLLWWSASLVFHALVLGWLFFFSPVRVVELGEKTSTKNVDTGRAAKVMDEVREKQAKTLEEDLRALEKTRSELAELEKTRRDELRANLPAVPEDAIEAVAKAQEDAAASQAAASDAMTKAEQEMKSAAAKGETAPPPGFKTASEEARTAQEKSSQLQAQALETLLRVDPKFEPAYKAQREANNAQSRAMEARQAATGQLTGASELLKKNESVVEDLKEAQADVLDSERLLKEAQEKLAASNKTLPQLQTDAAAAKLAADTAQTEYTSAQTSGDKDLEKLARDAANTAKKSASNAQKAADNTQKNLTRAQSDITKFEKRIVDQKARVQKFSSTSEPVAANADAFQKGATEKMAEALETQRLAKDAQQRAAGELKSIRAGGGSAAGSPQPTPNPDDLAGLYRDAVEKEAQMAQMYQELNAMVLSERRNIPLSQALDLTQVAKQDRPDLAPALQNSSTNSADLDAQKEAVLKMRAEIKAITSLTDAMLVRAKALAVVDIASQRNLEKLAAEDENQRVKDLTGAMQGGAASAAGGSQGSGAGGSSGGSAGGSGGSAGGGSGSAGGSGGGGSGGGSGSGSGTGSGGVAGGGGGAAGDGHGGNGDGGGFGGSGGTETIRLTGSDTPPPISKDLKALPGRVIGAGAVPGRWMFVDSWYLLGPYDNARRANIEKQFSPETIVDLNATYVGKRGRPMSWEFYQSPTPRVAPPFDNYTPMAAGFGDGGAKAFKTRDLEYIIYFGYTELRAEKDCDVWIAVGSDDFSKLWIEDQLVWASGQKLKSWRVDEGYRKVHLKKGVNRVVIRVENGHSQSEFSLALCAAS